MTEILVLTPVTLKISVIWDVASYSLVASSLPLFQMNKLPLSL